MTTIGRSCYSLCLIKEHCFVNGHKACIYLRFELDKDSVRVATYRDYRRYRFRLRKDTKVSLLAKDTTYNNKIFLAEVNLIASYAEVTLIASYPCWQRFALASSCFLEVFGFVRK